MLMLTSSVSEPQTVNPVLAFFEVTKIANVERRTYLCPRCVLEGYAHQVELHVVYEPDDLIDAGFPRFCDSCVSVLLPGERNYDANEIGVRRG